MGGYSVMRVQQLEAALDKAEARIAILEEALERIANPLEVTYAPHQQYSTAYTDGVKDGQEFQAQFARNALASDK